MATRKPQKPTAARKSGSKTKAPAAKKKAAAPAKKKGAAAAKKPPAKKKAAKPAAKPKAAPKKAAPRKAAPKKAAPKKAAGYKVPAKKPASPVKAKLAALPRAKPASKPAGPARNQATKERAKAVVKAGAYGGEEASPIRMTTTLLQTVELPASPTEVYRAYLDAPTHAKITGGTARIDGREGGRMTVGDGYIVGKFLELVEGSKIVQTWRTSEWPDGYEASRLELSLSATDDGTRLTMVHESVPTEQAKAYEQGWIDYYWEPMRKHFSGDSVAHAVREEPRDADDLATVVRGKAAEVYDDDGDDAEDDDDADTEVEAVADVDADDDDDDDLDDLDSGDDVLADDDLVTPIASAKTGPKGVAKPGKPVIVADDDDDDAGDDDDDLDRD